VVIRETGPWAPAVHSLLRHLEQAGFAAAPRLVGSGHFLRRDRETSADLTIERISDTATPGSDPLTSVVRRVNRATESLRMLLAVWPDWVRGFSAYAAINEFFILDEAAHMAIGGDPEVRTPLCRWEFDPGQALVIEVTPPECTYWNLQVATLWTEPVPTTTGVSCCNGASIELSDDGVARLIVAAEDPGVANWLDTGGRLRGTMCARWVGADSYPLPYVKVVALVDLKPEMKS
jgi:hypothetical protein